MLIKRSTVKIGSIIEPEEVEEVDEKKAKKDILNLNLNLFANKKDKNKSTEK